MKNGEQGVPSIEQEQLTALSTEMAKFKSYPRFSNRTVKRSRGDEKTKKAERDRKTRNKKGSDQWAWKWIPSIEGKSSAKNAKGKQHHWCIKHQAWILHSKTNTTYLNLIRSDLQIKGQNMSKICSP